MFANSPPKQATKFGRAETGAKQRSSGENKLLCMRSTPISALEVLLMLLLLYIFLDKEQKYAVYMPYIEN
jgi:hypothetical protein